MVAMAVLVAGLGRIGDVSGRVRRHNLGLTVFAFASIGLPKLPGQGAMMRPGGPEGAGEGSGHPPRDHRSPASGR